MKHIYHLFLLLLICIFALTSCQESGKKTDTENNSVIEGSSVESTEATEPEVPAVDMNITRYSMDRSALVYWNGGLYCSGNKSNPIVRFNIETGNVTSACYDPLCEHKSVECPIFMDPKSTTGFIISDGKLIYRRLVYEVNRIEHKIDIRNQRVMYDLVTTEYKIIKDEEREVGNHSIRSKEIYHNGNYYFIETSYDSKTGETFGGVCRINTENGKITDYSEKTKDMHIEEILFCINDRLYFTDAGSIFSTDMNLEDLQVHVTGVFVGSFLTDGEALYYAQLEKPFGEGNYSVYRLLRYDMTDWSCTELDILTHTDVLTLTDQYIYYAPFEAVDGDINKFYLNFSSIWRCKHDGSEKEKVFDLLYFHEGETEPYCTISIFTLADPVVVGDSMYAMFTKWEDLDGDKERDSAEFTRTWNDDDKLLLLHVNLVDGSYEIIGAE